jgi:hypothetical protein
LCSLSLSTDIHLVAKLSLPRRFGKRTVYRMQISSQQDRVPFLQSKAVSLYYVLLDLGLSVALFPLLFFPESLGFIFRLYRPPIAFFAFCSFRWTSAAHTQHTLTRIAGVNLRPNRCRRSRCLCVWGGLRKRSGGNAFAGAVSAAGCTKTSPS